MASTSAAVCVLTAASRLQTPKSAWAGPGACARPGPAMEGRLRLLRPPGRDRALLPNLRSAVFQSPIRAIPRVYFGMACSGYGQFHESPSNSHAARAEGRRGSAPYRQPPAGMAALWTCRCTRGRLHGPYWYLRWRTRGRQRRRYVPRKQVDATRAALEQRRRLRPPAWSLRQALAELRQLTKEVQHVGHDE